LRPPGERPRDLDELLFGDSELADRGVRVDLQAELREQLPRAALKRRPVRDGSRQYFSEP
jgi:hypothetical protein